jgi:hypothetical protein
MTHKHAELLNLARLRLATFHRKFAHTDTAGADLCCVVELCNPNGAPGLPDEPFEPPCTGSLSPERHRLVGTISTPGFMDVALTFEIPA